jgi:hypothetical protein
MGTLFPNSAQAPDRGYVATRGREIPVAYFGIHIHRAIPWISQATVTTWPESAFGTWRLWDAGVSWPALEPQENVYDFTLLDRYVSLAESARVELLLPLGLSPTWAAARPGEPSAYAPGNASEPRSVKDWERYVRRVATRYKGRIRAYEIWNEPNLKHFYSGSVETMCRLTEVAYKEIRDADPTALVVSPAPTGRAGLAWFREMLKRGGLAHADVAGYHFYVGQQSPPEEMAPLISDVRQALDESGLKTMGIWNTETGWVLNTTLPWPAGKSDRRWKMSSALDSTASAETVCRAFLVGLAMGLDRFYWYSWDHYAMGLVEPDGHTEKKAARTLRLLETRLIGTRLLDASVTNGTWAIRFERQDGSPFVIVWRARGTGPWKVPWSHNISSSILADLPPSDESSPAEVSVGSTPLLIEPRTAAR